VLATFIAATVPVESEGDVNPLLEAARSIGEKTDENTTDPDRPTPTPPGENNVGSYERFMLSFGSPARWAGRS
jgi:hypothetical protein